jgi:PAS domain-containing protein/nitrogen-specific signal transduction histidine kinase/ActR/RegA family two-component response regulator
MSPPIDPSSSSEQLPPALLQAWLAQSHDLLALTDAAGTLHWCNSAFAQATGVGPGADIACLAPPDWHAGVPQRALAAALRSDEAGAIELALRAASGAALWVDARITSFGTQRLWTLRDISANRELDARARHQADLLDIAQEFGRLGIWEREIPSGKGRWDRHVFGFWGMDPTDGTPDYPLASSRIHPEDQSSYFLESARRAGRYSQRYRVLQPDGSVRWIHSQWEVRNSAAGTPDRAIGIMVDDTGVLELARSLDSALSEQLQLSRRAEQLAGRLEAAAEAANIGLWTTVLGSDQTEWNAQMYALFDRIDASRPPTFAEWLAHCVHPDDRAQAGPVMRNFLRDGRGSVEVEFRTLLRDGRARWMVLRARIDRTPGQATRVYGIAMDVTERHEALAALHAASERAALIARHAGIGTWETDASGQPARWDEQMWRLRGLAPQPQAPDRDARLALVHPDDRGRLIDTDPDATGGPLITAYEFRVRLPDGSWRWLASRSTALCDEHGKPLRRVGVNWDITEAKNADLARHQAQLAERESRAKSEFLSRMSHELRTPLNAVLGFTELLQREARQQPADAGQLERLDHIRSAGEHLLHLVDDALDLSSLQAGTLDLELQNVSVAAAVADVLSMVAELAATHGVAVRSAALSGAVRADPARLRQVLLNLLTNAIKYNRAGGEVVVDAAVDGALLRLRVRDTGRGIRPQQMAHLYEAFNRLGVGAEGIPGSGIGLAVVKALLERMGGQIVASSEPGRGSVFEIALPQIDMPEVALPPDAPIPAAAPVPAVARVGQLLYIEDNPVNVLLVEELVRSLSGLRITSESSGAAGVARARALRPDLVLIDLQLPDFDGFEVLRRLREHPETAAIHCVALSANAMPDDIARGLAAGFDDYWTKPIRFKPFLEALDRLFPAVVPDAPTGVIAAAPAGRAA